MFRRSVAALLVVGLVGLVPARAKAQSSDAAAGDALCTTTTIVGLATTAGIVLLIYFLVSKSSTEHTPPPQPQQYQQPPAQQQPPSYPPPPAYTPPPPGPSHSELLRKAGVSDALASIPACAAPMAAELYLRYHDAELAHDLAAGKGPFLDAVADALQIQPAHQAAFRAALVAHRAELLQLARAGANDPATAQHFVERFAAIVAIDPAAGPDYVKFAEALAG